jgi:hypothetical protein
MEALRCTLSITQITRIAAHHAGVNVGFVVEAICETATVHETDAVVWKWAGLRSKKEKRKRCGSLPNLD